MRNHIGLRKVTARAHFLQLIKKRQVQIDFLVTWAIKRPCCRLPYTTSGLRATAVQHHGGRAVFAAKCLCPNIFGALKNLGHKYTLFIFCAQTFGSSSRRRTTTRHAIDRTHGRKRGRWVDAEYKICHRSQYHTADTDSPSPTAHDATR